MTLWLIVMTMAMMAAIGYVSDGGDALASKGRAIGDAYGAARAGAEVLDRAGFALGGVPTPDVGGARAAAAQFLAQAGVGPGEYQIAVSARQVAVTVHLRSPTPILGVIGVGPFTVTGSGSAQAIYGVRGPRP